MRDNCFGDDLLKLIERINFVYLKTSSYKKYLTKEEMNTLTEILKKEDYAKITIKELYDSYKEVKKKGSFDYFDIMHKIRCRYKEFLSIENEDHIYIIDPKISFEEREILLYEVPVYLKNIINSRCDEALNNLKKERNQKIKSIEESSNFTLKLDGLIMNLYEFMLFVTTFGKYELRKKNIKDVIKQKINEKYDSLETLFLNNFKYVVGEILWSYLKFEDVLVHSKIIKNTPGIISLIKIEGGKKINLKKYLRN